MSNETKRLNDWALPLQRIVQSERKAKDLLNEKQYREAREELYRIIIEANYAVDYCSEKIYRDPTL